ncbi:hypothetical protein QCA50_004472 [Cerrena zonata]|uniref:F-box domain-containing protein n=1 Tax=Cerrena zonata TaxID=2478898 RepID=A0AAW0GLN5_9APHY
MAKRAHSPVSLPLAKRPHTSSDTHIDPHKERANFDSYLYDEIILVIFSYLSWTDLCSIQSINRNWYRLSLDNQLWKSLYLGEYGKTRLRGVRGYLGRTDGREVKPLPGRAKTHHEDTIRDWKWMFRISSNWRTGRCSLNSLASPPTSPSGSRSRSPVSHPNQNAPRAGTHAVLAGNIIITAFSHPSSSPEILLNTPSVIHRIQCPSSKGSNPVGITALALDQSPPTDPHCIRLISFLSSGEFTVFLINHQDVSQSTRLMSWVPVTQSSRTSPIIQAVYHHPLLVTLSESFYLSLYNLTSNTITHTQTLSSFTSFPPSSLVLSSTSPGMYKLVLAYAVPVYPQHWSIGATELIISSSSSMTVDTSRTTKAFDVPQGWLNEQKMKAVREQWLRKVARVADTQTDGKWVVLASSDPLCSSQQSPGTTKLGYRPSNLNSPSSLQLYRLYLPSSSSPSSLPKLTFVRTLHGQMGPVSALTLADGRCVSLGVNGSIWVWDLEGGTGAEVSSGKSIDPDDLGSLDVCPLIKGSVVFDERQIISADDRGVEVRRFDV